MSGEDLLDSNYVQSLMNAGGSTRNGAHFTEALDSLLRTSNRSFVVTDIVLNEIMASAYGDAFDDWLVDNAGRVRTVNVDLGSMNAALGTSFTEADILAGTDIGEASIEYLRRFDGNFSDASIFSNDRVFLQNLARDGLDGRSIFDTLENISRVDPRLADAYIGNLLTTNGMAAVPQALIEDVFGIRRADGAPRLADTLRADFERDGIIEYTLDRGETVRVATSAEMKARVSNVLGLSDGGIFGTVAIGVLLIGVAGQADAAMSQAYGDDYNFADVIDMARRSDLPISEQFLIELAGDAAFDAAAKAAASLLGVGLLWTAYDAWQNLDALDAAIQYASQTTDIGAIDTLANTINGVKTTLDSWFGSDPDFVPEHAQLAALIENNFDYETAQQIGLAIKAYLAKFGITPGGILSDDISGWMEALQGLVDVAQNDLDSGITDLQSALQNAIFDSGILSPQEVYALDPTRCFPAGTQITMWDGSHVPIEDVAIGDTVLAFDFAGRPCPGQVTRLFSKTTQEWVRLECENGQVMHATPGHKFRTETGAYMEIGQMLRLGGGTARLVREDGTISTVVGRLVVYSQDTAQAFEQVAELRAAVGASAQAAGWRTYNFEVAEHHNYVAEGIRVHNESIFAFLTPQEALLMREIRDTDGDSKPDFAVIRLPGNTTEIEKYLDGDTAISEITTSDGMGNVIYYRVIRDIDGNIVGRSEPQYIQGQFVGQAVGMSLTPFLTQAILDDDASPFEEFVADTVFDTVLGNVGETIGALVGRANINYGEFSLGQHVETIAGATFEDFGGELIANGINNITSVVNQLIMAEIFEFIDADGIPGAIYEAVIGAGVGAVVGQGVEWLVGTDTFASLFGSNTQLLEQVRSGVNISTLPDGIDGASGWASLILGAVVREVLPNLETTEGQIASAVSGAILAATGALTTLGAFAGPVGAVISWAIGALVDLLFDKDPQAWTSVGFNEFTGRFELTGTWSDDGGDTELSQSLAEAYVNGMNGFIDVMQAESHNYGDLAQWSFGHYEESMKNAGRHGVTFKDFQDTYLDAYIRDLAEVQLDDGQMVAVRALENLNLDIIISNQITESSDEARIFYEIEVTNADATTTVSVVEAGTEIEVTLADGTVTVVTILPDALPEGVAILRDIVIAGGDVHSYDGRHPLEIYQRVAAVLQIADDYHTYLENAEAINALIAVDPNTPFAAGWYATIAEAQRLGLTDDYDLQGTEIDNVFYTAEGDDTVSGGAGDDLIKTYFGDDVLSGDAGDDNLLAGAGTDILSGGIGNDTLEGGAGADVVDGGDGVDWASFANAVGSVSVDLLNAVGLGGEAAGDTYANIEHLRGSRHDDLLVADTQDNTVEAGAGDDVVYGHAGDDILEGQDGDDYLFGDFADDTSVFGIDTLLGGAGNDILHGGEGLDHSDGGAGNDQVSYRHSLNGVRVSIGAGETRINGEVEYFTNVEGAIGSAFSDHLFGTSGANVFQGLAGDDRIDGGAGADTYVYSYGDGSDRIYDNDSNTANSDTLILNGVAASDVRFLIDRSDDLVISFDNGQSIFVTGQFAENQQRGIELVQFEGGETLTLEQIRNKAVADQKQIGHVIGSDHTEVYYHAEGDGSYAISDWDNNARTDRLVFSDLLADQVTFASTRNEDLVLTTQAGDVITIIDHFAEHQDMSIEEIEFSDGTVLDLAAIRDRSVADQIPNGRIIGSDLSETYQHSPGDGSYVIDDWDDNAGVDRLELNGTTLAEVSFDKVFGGHLVISLSNGEQITVRDHFDEHQDMSIEEIVFDDGTLLDAVAIRAKAIADQKFSGAINGTDFAEDYVHAQGDGSYSISDWDDNARTDRLTFSDVTADQVVFGLTSSRDLTLELPNGEVITVLGHFNEDGRNAVEVIAFSDGTELDAAAIRGRAVDDQPTTGRVVGTDFADTYTHAAGDGSYAILNRDDNARLDTLVFADIASTAASLVRAGDSLTIDLGNGEVVTVTGQFASAVFGVETITFADDVSYARADFEALAAPQTPAGTDQIGTDADEVYTHTMGDGSYSITDYDYWVGADSIAFADAMPDDVSVSRDGNNLLLTLTNGEVITVIRQLDTDRKHGIETVTFSDGTVWTERSLRDQMVDTESQSGLARGTENDETYVHAQGDGSYLISDYDYWVGTDRLHLVDTAADDIAVSRNGNDLEINFDNGEKITLLRQLDTDRKHGIETVEFSDGTIWTERMLRDRMVADQKLTGHVVGTENDETYTHRSGDGSWSLSDYDYWVGADRLILEDVASSDVIFDRLGNDVLIRLANGETITIDQQLNTDSKRGVETIEFSDGATLGRAGIQNRVAEDAKPSGVVQGTENDETYTHTSGDGSYAIRDYDYWIGADRLVLTDMLQSDVSIERVGADVVLTLAGGERIGLEQQLNTDNKMGIETIEFADGSTWDRTRILNETVALQVPTGIVRGTEQNEIYYHAQGDGSHRITDYDYWQGADQLVLTDTLASEVAVARQGQNVVLTLPNGETLTLVGQLDENRKHEIETIAFSDGQTWTPRQLRDEMVAQMKDDGVVWGTDQDETYFHTLGDGSYTVEDYDYWRGLDRLILEDGTPDDVIVSRYGNDALLTFSGGDVITLLRQLDENRKYSIEQFEFADGTIWNERALRDRMVSDAKVTGTVVGTENDETYRHFAVDGSYTITDYDYWTGDDNLIFEDHNADEVTFGRDGNDLLLQVGGEEIRVIRQLDENLRHSFEQIEFAGGTLLGPKAIRDRMVSDMKATGTVVGTENNESYFHSAGDGSYTLRDYDYWKGNDILTFTDLNADQVTFLRSGNDLVLQTEGGEQVQVQRQFDENLRHSLEQIVFADGTTLEAKGIRDRLVSDLKSTGTVVGTENNETYVHSIGDGSYTISDYDYVRGNDRLVFTDASPDNIALSRDGDSLIVTVGGVDTITLVNHLVSNGRYSIEGFDFADGTSWTKAQLASRLVGDMKAAGLVVGTVANDTIIHTSGDGSYTIDDAGSGSTADRLEFADQIAADITFTRSGSDAVLTLSNGEVITLKNQFETSLSSAIEAIRFSDGSEWGQKGLRDAIVAEQKSAGAVNGTGWSETYVHATGDGSYSISSAADIGAPADVLVFSDLLRAEVTSETVGNDVVLTTPTGESITLIGQAFANGPWQLKEVRFSDGEVIDEIWRLEDRPVGEDQYGGEGQNNYIHRTGYGSYTIFDTDPYSQSATDTLSFADLLVTDVTYRQVGNQTLEILTSAGEVITIDRHFVTSLDQQIERIVFMDGTVQNAQAIRNKSVADMKALGAVIGSELTESYVHTEGDGSYSIRDFDPYSNTSHDSFQFADLTVDQVTFAASGNALRMTTDGGDVVTVLAHFDTDYDYAIEEILFSDGTSLGAQAIRNKAVADMKVSGVVTGSELAQHYRHMTGDGSYTITDYDPYSNTATDTLEFNDVALADATFALTSGNSLTVTLTSGDAVTIRHHFDTDYDYAMEEIRFMDGVTLGAQAIRNKTVADMKPSGTVTGTELKQDYLHASGDGSYTITDFDPYSNTAADTLTFSDLLAADVTFTHGGSNALVMTTTGGEVITIRNHFDTDYDYALDEVRFADNVVMGGQAIRNKAVADMKPSGVVTGSELKQDYVHASGDGTYTITDYDPYSNTATDRLQFVDQNAGDVTFTHGASNALLMATTAGEVVTIRHHFDTDYDYALDEVQFADGSVLGGQAIRNKTVADMKSSGAVTGSELTQNYVHATGDGSYTITDFDPYSNSGTDTFEFTDISSSQAAFERTAGNELIMHLITGEEVTITNHFDTDYDYAIERVTFANDVTLNYQGIIDKAAAFDPDDMFL